MSISFCFNCCFKVNVDLVNDDCNGMKYFNLIISDDSVNLFNIVSFKVKCLFDF